MSEHKITGIVVNNIVYKIEKLKSKDISPCDVCELKTICDNCEKVGDFCEEFLENNQIFKKQKATKRKSRGEE